MINKRLNQKKAMDRDQLRKTDVHTNTYDALRTFIGMKQYIRNISAEDVPISRSLQGCIL